MAMRMNSPGSESRAPSIIEGFQGSTPPSLADTLIVTAQEANFQEVFMGQRSWYPVRLIKERKGAIQWIAPYQGKPVSAITCYARIERIESYASSSGYKIYFSEPVMLDRPVVLGAGTTQSIQGQRYTTLKKLLLAKVLTDLKPWD